jgi:hypothetical protein
MLEKLVWISAFMLVGARHGGCTVGEVESAHRDEVQAPLLPPSRLRRLRCPCAAPMVTFAPQEPQRA